MKALNYYVKALQFCDALEKFGMASIMMPEKNIFISNKLTGADRDLAIEAIGVYVRIHKVMNRIKIGLQIVSLCAIAIIAYHQFAG